MKLALSALFSASALSQSTDYPYQTSIHKAARDGEIYSVRHFFEKEPKKPRFDPNTRDTWNKTAAHYAAEYGHADIIVEMRRHRADLNARDYRQRTPLILAASKGFVMATRKLVGYKVDFNAVDESGRNALHWAAEFGHDDVINFLVANASKSDPTPNMDVNQKTISTGKTPLVLAAERGNDDCVIALLRNGAKADLADDAGATAAMYAAKHGHEDTLNVSCRIEDHVLGPIFI